ncbi:WD domain, G-beta repeat-containing protein [Besnoitia besnoiti]|uniref:WD domain, G-beta repeat-containing protein n=1 Tax=Besnoitia besnoiti TaxID=94643 RepID=A0A2A9MAV3_BESBE|nr:WD domain, G-beta repeat-containing protein [Besnoitia besnoiti]PFH32757.1 WD domain, G-beta repeat-containing protein [Besnoitia besnoiti]
MAGLAAKKRGAAARTLAAEGKKRFRAEAAPEVSEDKPQRKRLIPRKAPGAARRSHSKGLLPRKSAKNDDEEILSDDADGLSLSDDGAGVELETAKGDSSDDETEGELPDERRLRLAREYLSQLAAQTGKRRRRAEEEDDEEGEEDEGESDEEEEMAKLLRKEADGRSASAFRSAASSLALSQAPVAFLRGHKLPLTCVAAPGVGDVSERAEAAPPASALDRHVYTGGKDCCVVLWDLQEEKKIVFEGRRNDFHGGGHFRPVLDVCVAPDESFFCSVGEDQVICIWDARSSTKKCVASLRGHSGAVRSVKFNAFPTAASLSRGDTSSFSSSGDIEIVTCSADKSLRLWNLNLRACVNSFYGHTAAVASMDILQPNKPLTVGEDNCARSWKLVQDTHLVFSPQLAMLDCCALLTPSLFACGSASGVVSLYSSTSKKPLAAQFARQEAKKSRKSGDGATAESAGAAGRVGVTAMTAMRRTDTLFSATEDGRVQLWKATTTKKGKNGENAPAQSLSLLSSSAGAPSGGIVAGLTLTPSHSLLVAGVSKESKFGRWVVDKNAKNGLAVYRVQQN